MPLDRTANRSPSPISATSISSSSSSSSSSRSLTSPSPSPSASSSSSSSSTAPRAATWIPDSAVTACHSCKASFTLTRRRHHCRSCGNIFCNACSLSRSTLPSHSSPVRVCQPCHNFELSRQKFISHECDMLVKGHIFLKHANGVGCARYRWIKLSPDHQSIYWHPDNAPCKPNSTIYLSEIMEIREGQTTASFKRTGKSGRESLCFSIVTKGRTLDLETEDQTVRDTWISALKNALLHVNKLSPAEMKRREQLHADRVRAQQQAIEQQQQVQQEKQEKIQQRTERIQGIRQKYQTTR